MGTFSTGGAAGLIERGVAGRAGDVGAGLVAARENTGFGAYNYGSGLTEEGLGGLRSLDSTYQNRLNDPLGAAGRGIFARARGNLSDDFTRTIASGQARRAQLAAQSGGTLTPEQVAALDSQDRRAAGEGLFKGESDVSQSEAAMTMSETGKLFDRMESIRKTIVGVGQDEKSRALSSIIDSLKISLDRNKALDQSARSWVSMFMPKPAAAGPMG